jgi:hypothetical protein
MVSRLCYILIHECSFWRWCQFLSAPFGDSNIRFARSFLHPTFNCHHKEEFVLKVRFLICYLLHAFKVVESQKSRRLVCLNSSLTLWLSMPSCFVNATILNPCCLVVLQVFTTSNYPCLHVLWLFDASYPFHLVVLRLYGALDPSCLLVLQLPNASYSFCLLILQWSSISNPLHLLLLQLSACSNHYIWIDLSLWAFMEMGFTL